MKLNFDPYLFWEGLHNFKRGMLLVHVYWNQELTKHYLKQKHNWE